MEFAILIIVSIFSVAEVFDITCCQQEIDDVVKRIVANWPGQICVPM